MQLQHKMATNRAHQQQRGGMNPYGVVYPHQMQPQSMRSNMVSNTLPYPQSMGAPMVSTNYAPTNMYGTPSSAPHMQPAPARVCNISSEAQIISSSPIVSSNIGFRKLPFFKLKYPILKPTILSPNTGLTLPPNVRTSANQEFNVSFVLSCAMASDLAMFRDMTKNDFVVQAQLRITATDTTPITPGSEYDDFLPFGLMVRVNGRQCSTLPPCTPSTRQGQESRRIPRPINITQLVKLSPMNVNNIIINWTSEINKSFVITLNVVEKLSAEFLLMKLKERQTISVDCTKLTIRQQYRRVVDDDNDATGTADDDDIAATIIRFSLQCPLVKFRMQYPARGRNCTHLQCFDGSAYISLNEKKPMWMCPVCSKPLYYDDLALDQYFMDVLRSDQLSDDCQEVQLFVDGTWKSYDEEKASENNENGNTQSNSPNASPGPSTSIITPADSSDDTVDRKDLAVSQPPAAAEGNAADPVVDLTCEDEDVSESAAESEQAISNIEERRDSNSSSSLTPAPQPEDSEKASSEVSSMDVSLPDPSTDTGAPVISSAADTLNLPIISLDSPSPSPPPFRASNTPALDSLNIDALYGELRREFKSEFPNYSEFDCSIETDISLEDLINQYSILPSAKQRRQMEMKLENEWSAVCNSVDVINRKLLKLFESKLAFIRCKKRLEAVSNLLINPNREEVDDESIDIAVCNADDEEIREKKPVPVLIAPDSPEIEMPGQNGYKIRPKLKSISEKASAYGSTRRKFYQPFQRSNRSVERCADSTEVRIPNCGSIENIKPEPGEPHERQQIAVEQIDDAVLAVVKIEQLANVPVERPMVMLPGNAEAMQALVSLESDIIISCRLNDMKAEEDMVHLSVEFPVSCIGKRIRDRILSPVFAKETLPFLPLKVKLNGAYFALREVGASRELVLFPRTGNNNYRLCERVYELPARSHPEFASDRVQLGVGFFQKHVVYVNMKLDFIILRNKIGEDIGKRFWRSN